LGPLKVCVVAVDVGIPGYRGASVHVYEVSRMLAERGHEVHVVCRRYSADLPEHEVLGGFHVHRIYRGILAPVPFSSYGYKRRFRSVGHPLRSVVRFLYRIYLRSVYLLYASLYTMNVVKEYDLDVILERETSLGCGALASILSGKPMVLEINGPVYSSLSLSRASKIFAYPQVCRKLIERGIFAAVDTDIFRPDPGMGCKIRDKYGLGDDPVVGYVGIFAAWHGVRELLEASQIVVREIPSAKFLLVGPYHHDWERRVEGKKISDSLIFVGPVPHESVPEYINAADVLVAPFNPTGADLTKKTYPFIPFKILEYMACAKPVVSTSVGQIPQIIKHGESGVLVPPGDSAALANGILMLLKNPRRGKRMGEKARADILDRYSWRNYYATLIEIFRESLG